MLRFLCSLAILCGLQAVSAVPSFAKSPDECLTRQAQATRGAPAMTRVEPCLVIESGKTPQRTPYPIDRLACFGYQKLSGLSGTVRFFALRHFVPTLDPVDLRRQLEDPANQVLGDAYWTGTEDYWCRGRHWFKEANWVVMCDENGGIGWVTGDSFRHALRHTWLPKGSDGKPRRVIMGVNPGFAGS